MEFGLSKSIEYSITKCSGEYVLGLGGWVIVLSVDDVQQQFAIVWGCVYASDFIYLAGCDEGLAWSRSWINTVDRGFQSSDKYLDTDSSLICSSVRWVIVTIPCQRGSDWAKWCLTNGLVYADAETELVLLFTKTLFEYVAAIYGLTNKPAETAVKVTSLVFWLSAVG